MARFSIALRTLRGLAVALVLALVIPPPASARAGQAAHTLPPRINPAAQKLLDQAIAALGGEAFLHFKTLTTTGRVYLISDEATAALFSFVSQQQFPNRRRFSYGKNPPVILINNGNKAIELDRMGVTNQTPEQARRWAISNRYSLENLLRLRIHEPGVLVQDGGVDFVNNLPVQVVEIFDTRNVAAKLFLQQSTYLPIRVSYRALNPKTDSWEEFADEYSDFRSFQGIETAMHIAHFFDGERVSEVFRNTARYGEDYPPGAFEANR